MNDGKSSSLRGNTSRDRIASASETSSKACPKTLRISPNIQVIPHLALSDYTDEEYDTTWETENDRARSHRHLVETLLLMRTNDGDFPTAHQDDHTSRGLECMASPATLQRSKATKAAVIDAVLDEQDRQFDQYEAGKSTIPINDPERLASVSLHYSRANVVYAAFKALQDAKEVASF